MKNITNDELIELLKGRLSIHLSFHEGGTAYWSGDHKLKVKLKVGSTVISEDEIELPNKDRQSEY